MNPTVRRLGVTVLLGAVLLAPTALTGQQHFPAGPDLQLMLHYLVEDGVTPGIVLATIEPDGSSRVLAAGTGGPDTAPLGPRSVFEIGSINKTFTGTLLALAVRRGEVSLDDPVSDHLPDSVRVPSRNGREITLVDLATHRSGLPGVPTNFVPADLGDPYATYTLEVLYSFLSGYELPRDPGAEAEYSNLGFGLLGHALARAAGTPYTELLRDRILEPLGMASTGYTLTGDMAGRMTEPHVNGQVVPPWSAGAAIRGAGGLRSSAEDMLKYLAANIGPPETELEHAMRDAHRVRARFDEDREIGLGWRTLRPGDRTIVEHGGNTAGSSARIAFDPERQVGFVRLTNIGGFSDDLGLYLLRTGPPLDLPAATVSEDVLARYVGAYEMARGANVYIRLEDEGYLTSQLGTTSRFRLYPDSDSSFYQKRLKIRMAFTTDGSGEVDALVLNPGPRGRSMPKVGGETPPPELPSGPEIIDLPLSGEEVALYAGTYTIAAAGRELQIEVTDDTGGLMVGLVDGPRNRLRSQGGHVFIPTEDPASRVVFDVRDGRAVAMRLDLHGQVRTARRRGVGVTPEVLDLPVTAEDIARYQGTYLLEFGRRTLEMRIFGRGNRLMSQPAGQRVTPLRYQGDHVFIPDFDDTARLVFTVDGDRATRLTLYQGGGRFTGERQP